MFFEILQILHDISPFFWCSLICVSAVRCPLTTQDEILVLLWWVKKEIKTHLVFDCLSKFTFGQGFTQLVNKSYFHLYHTCIKKSIEGSQLLLFA